MTIVFRTGLSMTSSTSIPQTFRDQVNALVSPPLLVLVYKTRKLLLFLSSGPCLVEASAENSALWINMVIKLPINDELHALSFRQDFKIFISPLWKKVSLDPN